MTPAKTVREQVEQCIERWRAAGEHYQATISADGIVNAVAERKLNEARWDSATLLNIYATLFAAAEETKAENERLTTIIRDCIRYGENPSLASPTALVIVLNMLRGALNLRQQAALNPGGSET